MLLELVQKHEKLIKSCEVLFYDISGSNMALRGMLTLVDDSVLWIRYYMFDGSELKYAFHWQSADNRLLFRWDNEPHWPEVESYPHHCHHTGETGAAAVTASYAAGDLDKVLQEVEKILKIA